MRNARRGICFALFLILAVGISFGQIPDFSGEWKLNIGKSELPAVREPERASITVPEMTWIVRQEGLVLTIEQRARGEVKMRRYTADGKEFLNAGSSIKDLKGTACFLSGKLIVKTEEEALTITYSPAYPDGNIEYNKVMMAEEYSLSADGKTLEVAQAFETPDGGSKTMKLVFEKVGS